MSDTVTVAICVTPYYTQTLLHCHKRTHAIRSHRLTYSNQFWLDKPSWQGDDFYKVDRSQLLVAPRLDFLT